MLFTLYLISVVVAFAALIVYLRLTGVAYRHMDPLRLSLAASFWPGTLIYVAFAAVMRR